MHDGTPSKAQLIELFERWGQKHPLHTHPYLDNLFDPQMDDLGRVRRFTEVLYMFCERFHDCLFALGYNARKHEAVRRALADNLHDEYGTGDPRRAHLSLMRNLLYSIGYTDRMIRDIKVNPSAQRFMDEIVQICHDEPPLKGVGCICIGAECNGSQYFRRIFEAFKKKSCLAGANLYILEIHAGDDVRHRARMLELIEPFLDDEGSRAQIHDGYMSSVLLFNSLWTAMALEQDSFQRVA